ncbi:MAG TPA: class I SAM-dependent methyltransferase [Coleofasciculaceae cyanobacterium]|jgi:SAM-dependent methyltransferase
MYYELAHLYDWPGSLDFAAQILARVRKVCKSEDIAPPARMIDLACGTGTLALALAQEGYDVQGIDLSVNMLAQARRKQAEADPAHALKLIFREADMRYFQTEEPVDLVICHYDSLNHLSNETELRATFLQVPQALKPGGLFLFDLNTLENFRTFWNGSDTDEGPNYRLKTVSRFDETSGRAAVTFSVDEYTDEGELLHRSEEVCEQYFNEMAVEKYLMAADFHDIQFEAFNPVGDIPADFPLKTFWRCRRR